MIPIPEAQTFYACFFYKQHSCVCVFVSEKLKVKHTRSYIAQSSLPYLITYLDRVSTEERTINLKCLYKVLHY